LAELFGNPVSEGTVARMSTHAAAGLEGFLIQVTDRIAQAEVAGFDETGLRVAGALHWVRCARTDKYTLITCHPNAARRAIDDAGVLGPFRGVAVHDAWAPYDTYLDVDHQLCCAPASAAVTVAEGVETPAQADWLRNASCTFAQGTCSEAVAVTTNDHRVGGPAGSGRGRKLGESNVPVGT
jgi:hypothetical protein